jgi:NAD(P)-dependent dehydrogenase (short-subunit alcohol dehydrogenase family)
MTSERKQGVVWVAGVGASAGLGAALARRFAREGLLAVVTGRTAARVEAVASEIVNSGGEAVALPGDVANEASIQGIARKIAELGTLEVAIFNAGNQVRAPSLELTVEQLEEAWRINTLGGFIFSREALRQLVPQQRGSLLITGATGSLRGKPPFGAFASAKAGLRSLAQTFARELGPQGRARRARHHRRRHRRRARAQRRPAVGRERRPRRLARAGRDRRRLLAPPHPAPERVDPRARSQAL